MRTAQLGLRCILSASLAFVFLVGSAPVPAGAESEISIPFDDLIFGAPGSVILLAEVEVDAELVGRPCLLSVLAKNQSSVHIGNDLIVSTGTSQAVVVGVEDTANGGTNQTYQMVVGPTIMVQIRIGRDGMSSLGFGLSFDCETVPTVEVPDIGEQQTDRPAESTTTTSAPATTAAPTTASTTTTTTPPPAASSVPATVAGAVTTNSLPEAPPARAVTGSPAYTG